MRNRPLPVVIVAILFIAAGCVGFVYHFIDFFEPNAKVYDLIWIEFVRIVAVVCGFLLLRGINWARWLAIAWLLFHVVISALNSTSEMIAHLIFLIIVIVLLYLPVSSSFFQNKNTQSR
ncbi:MAG: hypothetical protein KGM16_00345 [Bacteroidota bacterium]|nr:hypothetical protein [Bacteroidota bacterium]